MKQEENMPHLAVNLLDTKNLTSVSLCKWIMTQNIHLKATREFLKAQKFNVLQWTSRSPDHNPTQNAFHILNTQLNADRRTNKQQLKAAASQGRKCKMW